MIKKILYGIIFSQITFSQSLDSNEINSLARGKAQSAFKEYREFLSLPNDANKQNELTLHRVSLEKNSQINFKLMKVKWNIENGKLYRTLFDFGNEKPKNQELVHDFKQKINFKIEKVSNLLISNKDSQITPSLLSIEFGDGKKEVYTFRIGNNL